eukprot:10377758-Karenia_brevis.AAC.1
MLRTIIFGLVVRATLTIMSSTYAHMTERTFRAASMSGEGGLAVKWNGWAVGSKRETEQGYKQKKEICH